MKKILFRTAVIVVCLGSMALGGTGAFFSDTETSVGNTFAAGAIDLKVDNESYYNGTLSPSTSWALQDLKEGLLFFNFKDLKPDDEGEDTISLHVNDNDAYLCMDVVLTSDDDNSSAEPELETPDDLEDINNTWDGELGENFQMFWWADDGDNVYEVQENSISGGVKTLASLATTSPFSATLADAGFNAWGASGPIPGGETRYIGKAWCYGTLGLDPETQDGQGHLEGSPNGPLVRGTGVVCDGSTLNNLTQSDGVTLDVAFRAIQARHNDEFTCGGSQPRISTVKVVKQIVNDNGGNNVVTDFQLFIDNGIVVTPVTSNIATQVTPGTYTVTETGIAGYVASFDGDCDVNGELTVADGESKTCIIVNNDLPANITLIKNVINNTNDGDVNAGPTQFGLKVDGFLVQNNTSTSTSSNVPHTINEAGRIGYSFVGPIIGTSNYGKSCPAILGGSITLDEGEAITCTITNDDN